MKYQSVQQIQSIDVTFLDAYIVILYFCHHSYLSDSFLTSLCTTCFHVLSMSSVQSPFRHRLIVSLALSPIVLKSLWESISTMTLKRTFGSSVNVLDMFRHGSSNLSSPEAHSLLYQLATLSVLLYVSLSSLHDVELFTKGPFPFTVLSTISLKLRDVFVNLNMHLLHPPSSYLTTSGGINHKQHNDQQSPNNAELQFLSNVRNQEIYT